MRHQGRPSDAWQDGGHGAAEGQAGLSSAITDVAGGSGTAAHRVCLGARWLLLHPPAHVVDGAEAEPGHVERLQHPDRLGQAGAQRGRVAAGRIERGDRECSRRCCGSAETRADNASAASGDDIEQPRQSRVNDAGDGTV